MRTSMNLFAGLLVVMAALALVQCQDASTALNQSIFLGEIAPVKPGSKIVGGAVCAITTAPYQLSLELSGSHICGASLISTLWAVTAAHCVVNYAATSLSLRAGSATLGSGGVVKTVVQKISHSNYNPLTIDYDIAVLKVSSAYTLTTSIAVISLHASGATIAGGTSVSVSGWGQTVYGSCLPTQLQCVSVPIVDSVPCQTIWAAGLMIITPRMVCAGGLSTGGKGSCKGDSGGPMVAVIATKKTLVGVVSWGYPCAKPHFPDVYARISALRTWITTNTGV